MNEEFQEPTSLNVEQAADQLLSQLDPVEETEDNQGEEVEIEAVEVADDAEAETEVEEDQAVEEEQSEATGEIEDAELFYELDGEEVSLAQLKEWREGGLKAKDYTEKTQKLASERKEVETRRIAVQQELQAIQQERAQLQEALASLAIDGEQEPNWANIPPERLGKELDDWKEKKAQKQQATQAYQALQQQQLKQNQQREIAALLQKKPEWSDPTKRDQDMAVLQSTAISLNYTPEEFAGMPDHRMIMALSEIASLRARVAEFDKTAETVSKRVVKAQPRKASSAKSPKETAESKALKQSRAKFQKTGSINDATDMLMAQLNS